MRLRLLAEPAVRSAVSRELGRDIEYADEMPSTQDRALALADPGIVVADHQTSGRGTRDRVWIAPPGSSLLASWAYRPAPAAPASLLAGVAIVRALDTLGVRDAALKWPNDVLLSGRKAAGALAHATTGGENTLVLGIGVNVRQRGFPEGLRYPATSLALEGHDVDRLALLVALTRELDRALADSDDALRTWRERSAVLGREVTVEREGEPALRGRARDLDRDGALVLETDRGTERVLVGDVSFGGAR